MNCEVCNNTGWQEIDESQAVPCRCRADRLFVNLCNKSNVGLKWRRASLPLSTAYNLKANVGFEKDDKKEATDVNELLSFFLSNIGKGVDGLYFYGNTGRGKTWTAYAILMDQLKQGNTVFAIKEEELLEHAFGAPTDEEQATRYYWVHEEINYCNVLFIDEVGATPLDSKNYKKGFFNELIRARHDKGMITIMTSNLTPKSLGERNGRRIHSFLKEFAFCVEFVSDRDYRDVLQQDLMNGIEGLLK